MVAAGAIVDEADDLVAELAMLQHAVGKHPTEIAGAGNEMRFSPTPARQRCSSSSRTASREA
jgi:hypothetical protein